MIKRNLISLTVIAFLLIIPLTAICISFKVVDAKDIYWTNESFLNDDYKYPNADDLFENLFNDNDLTNDNNSEIDNNEINNVNDNNIVNENVQPETKQVYDMLIKANTNVNIRAGAGVEFVVIGSMDKGDLLPYKNKSGSFYETFYKGKKAYISTNYTSLINIQKSSERVEQVLDFGKTLLGHPYVFGATRVHDGNGNLLKGFKNNQFDCSSFTQYIYYKGASINIGVTTRTQIYNGKEISKANIERGDLLFFTNASRKNNKGIERVGHVAIYLGNNYILHTASDHSVIEEISSTRWSYYISARRII